VLLGLAIGLQALRMRIAQAAVDNRAGAKAVAFRPQNGWGQALLAEQQLSDGNVDAAIASSRRALDRTPLTVVAVRTMARSLDTKTPAGGEHAWQIASTMGWRDPQTQLWALLRALSNGQTDIFVIRADALMRTQTGDPKMLSVVRQAMIEPRVRAAFLRRIALDPDWRSELFIAGQPLRGRELQGTVLALRGLGATNVPPTRAELHDSLTGLIAEGRFEEAVALDRRFVARKPDPGSLIDDGGFDRVKDDRADYTPFDWTLMKSASLEQSGGQRSMLLTRSTHRQPLVQRLVPLAPGRYRLTYSVKGDADSPASIGVTVRCIGSRTDLAVSSREPLPSSEWNRRSFDFAIPADCPLTILELTGLRGSHESEAQFDNISIAPIG
jgi:hypothetical protein